MIISVSIKFVTYKAIIERVLLLLGPMKLHYQFLVLPFLYFHAGRWSLFIHLLLFNILSFWGCGFLELIGTAQIINEKEAWLAFQGNNDGRCGRLKQMWAGMRNEHSSLCGFI